MWVWVKLNHQDGQLNWVHVSFYQSNPSNQVGVPIFNPLKTNKNKQKSKLPASFPAGFPLKQPKPNRVSRFPQRRIRTRPLYLPSVPDLVALARLGSRRLALPDEPIRPRRAFLAAFAPGGPERTPRARARSVGGVCRSAACDLAMNFQ